MDLTVRNDIIAGNKIEINRQNDMNMIFKEPSVRNGRIWRIDHGNIAEVNDDMAVEEPLEIRLSFNDGSEQQIRTVAVTMRTPGADDKLAIGFLYTEGIITSPEDIVSVSSPFSLCSRNAGNIIEIELRTGLLPAISTLERNFYVTSSCGICGKASIDAVRTKLPQKEGIPLDSPVIELKGLLSLPARVRQAQEVFESTGGLHASALFDRDLQLLWLMEDVGRHNALDKAIGATLLNQQYFGKASLLLLSGRASFELIQKAAMAGIIVVAAIGAPSSLAVSMAEDCGITLIGFMKEHKFNIYTHPNRIKI